MLHIKGSSVSDIGDHNVQRNATKEGNSFLAAKGSTGLKPANIQVERSSLVSNRSTSFGSLMQHLPRNIENRMLKDLAHKLIPMTGYTPTIQTDNSTDFVLKKRLDTHGPKQVRLNAKMFPRMMVVGSHLSKSGLE